MFDQISRAIIVALWSFQTLSCSNVLAVENDTLLIKKEQDVSLKNKRGEVEDPLNWKRYDYSQMGGFSIKFPEKPDHTDQIIEIPQSELTIQYNTYMTERKKDGSVYIVSVWDYPDSLDMSRPELNLQEGFSGMLQALPDSQVLFMQASQIQGHKSLEFWIRCDDIYFRGMLISVNHTLYQVFVVYKSDDSGTLEKEYKTFIQSFKITKVKDKKPAKKKVLL